MSWFRRTNSPEELRKQREDQEFIEAIRCMAIEVYEGRMTNHGLSEYGAKKLMESGKTPGPLDHQVLLSDGTFITYDEWVKRNS